MYSPRTILVDGHEDLPIAQPRGPHELTFAIVYYSLQILAVVAGDGNSDSLGGLLSGGSSSSNAPARASRGVAGGAVAARGVGRNGSRDLGGGTDLVVLALELGGLIGVNSDGDRGGAGDDISTDDIDGVCGERGDTYVASGTMVVCMKLEQSAWREVTARRPSRVPVT